MAYETGIASDQHDLLDKLQVFAVANGWTLDEFSTVNKRLCIHKSTVFVQFRYDAVDAIALYQSLGYIDSSTAPGNHTDDSGNGQTAANPITTDRRINRIGNGPFNAYHFFLGSTYIHVALEVSVGLYRHMSFGIIVKNGTWTGGEYCAGHVWAAATTGGDSNQHGVLVDWAAGIVQDAATIHLEGVAGDPGTQKWGLLYSGTSPGNDRGGNLRLNCIGGWRDGFLQNAIGFVQANPNSGYVPMFPLQVFRRKTGVSPQQWYLLGALPDIRGINIGQVVPGEEFTVGTDVWKVFPWVRKRFTFATPFLDESGNLGVAYKKVP